MITARQELRPPVVSSNVIVEDKDDTYKNDMTTVHHRENAAGQNTQSFMFSKGQKVKNIDHSKPICRDIIQNKIVIKKIWFTQF